MGPVIELGEKDKARQMIPGQLSVLLRCSFARLDSVTHIWTNHFFKPIQATLTCERSNGSPPKALPHMWGARG